MTGYSVANFLGALLAQMGFLFPSLGIPLWWVSLKALLGKPLDQFDQWPTSLDPQLAVKCRFLLWAGLPVAAGFTLLSGLTHTFPAWPVPGLWSLMLLLAGAAARWPQRLVRRWLKITGLIVSMLLMVALSHITLGTLQNPSRYALFGGWVAPQHDPSTALIDVVQLRRQLSQSPAFRAAIAEVDFVITPEYWLSGYIAMAMPEFVNLPVSSFTSDPRGHAFWFHPQDWLGKNALLISFSALSQEETDDPLSQPSVLGLAAYFHAVTPLGQVAIKRGNVTIKTFDLYRADTLLRPYVYPY